MGELEQLESSEHDGHAGLEEWIFDSEGKDWHLVDGDYYCVAGGKDDDDGEAEEYDPVASARLFQRSIAQFSRPSVGVSREQLAEMRRKWAARRAERAREERTRAQSDQACRSHPEPTPAPRPRANRTRRPPTRSHASADPTPPPEPDPAPTAAAALNGIALAGQPARAVPLPALPSAFLDRRAPALREGVADHEGGPSLAPRPGIAGRSSSISGRSRCSGPTPPLDQRLRPFAHALADLLLADLLKYPPKP